MKKNDGCASCLFFRCGLCFMAQQRQDGKGPRCENYQGRRRAYVPPMVRKAQNYFQAVSSIVFPAADPWERKAA